MDPKKIKAIDFDFDGTICDSLDIKGQAFADLYKSYGHHVQDIVRKYHAQNGGIPRDKKFLYFQKEIIKEDSSEKKIENLSREFSDIVTKKVIAADFIPGASEFIKDYHKRYSLYISSATPILELQTIVREKKIYQYFKNVYGSPKSKSEHISTILNNGKFSKDEIVFIGDASSDIYAAESMSIAFIGVGNDPAINASAYKVDSLLGLEEILIENI